jgi:molybdate transport system substrate-binding protein
MTSLQFLGAVAVRPAVLPAIADFEAQTGVVVACRWDLNPAIDVQIRAGASFDLVVTNPHFIEQLSVLGNILANTQVPFGRIGLGIAARADADRPRIDTQETFEAALQNATSIAYASEGSSGAHFVDLLERLGLTRDVGPKLIPVAGAGTASSVARGEAELAVVPRHIDPCRRPRGDARGEISPTPWWLH